jgi:hypothetical protein
VNLQSTVPTYTVLERANRLYKIATNIFDWNKTSDCVTPLEVAQKQFARCKVGGNVCIPGAGIGTYIVAALQAGFKPENITAVEIDRAYYEMGAAIYQRFGVNYVLADFLEWNPQMQFDVIVGNPPFQNGGNSAFYTKFFAKVETLLAQGGYFSLISPSKAAAKFSKGYKELAKVGWNSVEYGVDSLFPNIEQPMAIYSGSTADVRNGKLEVIANGVSESFERGTVLPVQYVGSCKQFPDADANLTLSIFEKFFKSENKLKEKFEVLDEAPSGPYVYLTAVAWRYHPAREKGGPYALLAQLNEHDQYLNGKFIRCKTQKEAEQIQWLLSRSLAYRFVAAASCRAKFLPRVLLEETPFWGKVTTDEALFNLLGFTQEEITYINHWNRVTAGK